MNVRVGNRVEIHPALDAWIQGDRYGEIFFCSGEMVTVEMDSGRVLRIFVNDIFKVIS
jgi:hypothetical protein